MAEQSTDNGGDTDDRPARTTRMHEVREYDVVVVGAGAVGENVADRASRTGLTVVVVEAELVGGECSYWACMPSKALLRPGAVLAAARAVPGAAQAVGARVDPGPTLDRRDAFASHWQDSSQVEWLDGAGIDLIRGRARLTGPRRLEITRDDEPPIDLTARHAVVIASGSEAVIPPIEGLDTVAPWTSREATSAWEVPGRLAVIGGGVVATELATAFDDLGSEVTVLVRGPGLLEHAEPFAGQAVARALTTLGVDLRLRTEVTRAYRDDAGVHLALGDGSEVVADEVLVAAGRRPATGDLGLEHVGLRPGDPLEVDDALQVAAVTGGWLFAVGDVTGRTHTTHQGKYDARVAGDVVAARFGSTPEPRDASRPLGEAMSAGAEAHAGSWSRFRASADEAATPQVVFTRPEVASVGLTEAAARQAGLPVRAVRYDLGAVAGAALAADGYEGTAQLLVDTERRIVLGATFVGPEVAELLHAATIAVVGQVPLDRLWHAVPAYPTVSEVWLRLLETAGL